MAYAVNILEFHEVHHLFLYHANSRMIVPIIEPSNPATIMNMKYTTDNVIPLIRKSVIPSSGVMKAG